MRQGIFGRSLHLFFEYIYTAKINFMYEKQLKSIERLLGVMDRLREECPWDREQTFESLRNNTIEETFELTDAITEGDMDGIREELGDLLLHIVFYSRMGAEQGRFDIGDVADSLCDKLIYRHPHVYGEVDADSAQQVIHNWEELKLAEKRKKARKDRKGVLSGVPRNLPAMVKAYRIGQKAAAAGFDWERREDVWNKVREEVGELQAEVDKMDRSGMEEEIGDLLFAIVNMSRLYGIDPENALERSNKKFIRRFGHIEECAERRGAELTRMKLEEMEECWQEAKEQERRTAR